MAAEMVSGALLSAILQVLGERLLKALIPEVTKVHKLISDVKAFIIDAEEQRVTDSGISDWLNELEDHLLDAQDLLDEMRDDNMRLPEHVDEVCAPFSTIYRKVFLKNFGQKLKAARLALEEVIARKPNGLMMRTFETIVGPWPVLPAEKLFIGRETDMSNVMKLLLESSSESEESVSVIFIVGVQGIGKTVLARRVFDHVNVQNHFDLRMWIGVSEVFELNQIVWRIIESATGGQSLKSSNMDQLMSNFAENIRGKRCLLVLDDVRNEKWHQLLEVLRGGAKGSQILVTTSNPDLAQASDSRKIYSLNGLDYPQSWQLFKQFVFEHEEELGDKFREIGDRILAKCAGNPLAIETIGSMLHFKCSIAEWSSFETNQFSRISQMEDIVLPLLWLKYHNLPQHLKNCFAYCAVFPKQYDIDVKTLINLWIAQGFITMSSQSDPKDKGVITHEETKSLEDVGYGYFCDLLSREFFQSVEKDENGKVIKCKIPYYDVVMFVGGAVCLPLKLNEEKIGPKTCHVSFHFHLDAPWQVPTSLDKAKRIRTILLPSQLRWETEGRPGKSICGKILSSCRFLRVLDLHNSGIRNMSGFSHKLKHLRYLDLSHNRDIRRLPNSITKLHHLHTLKLNYCSRLEGLPRDTRNLVELRHLEIEGCYSFTDMPLGIGQLTNLRTLSEFVLSKDSSPNLGRTESKLAKGSTKSSCGLDELKGLYDLQGQLLIKNLKRGENYGDANLKRKELLRSLVLIWDVAAMKVADCTPGIGCSSNEDERADDYLMSLEGLKPHVNIKELSVSAYGGVRFPEWFASLENLVRVSLWRCMNCQYLPRLDKFSRLKILVLGQLTSLEYLVDNVEKKSSSEALLSSLEELHLIELPKLKGWWREKVEGEEDHGGSFSITTTSTTPPVAENQPPSFSRLSKLVIENCPELISIPLFPCLDELLELNNSGWKPFQQTMTSNTAYGSVSSSVASTSSLSPFSKLRCLHIVGIKEVEMCDADAIRWSLFNKNLRSLTFDHLPQLKTLPEGLQDIVSLQELHISRCDNLEVIPHWIRNLESLKKVSIRLLPSLISLPEGMSSHTSSIKLEIEDCPKIARNPNPVQDLVKHYLKDSAGFAKANAEEVVLNGSSYTWEQFQQEVNRISSNPSSRVRGPTQAASPSASRCVLCIRSFQALNEDPLTNHHASSNPKVRVTHVLNLCTLHLDSIGELQYLPEWLNGLNCVKKLSIWNCPNLKHLSPGIHHFTLLQELDIYKCEELDMLNDDATKWQDLRRLKHVTFQELPKLVDLPGGLRHLTALQKLHVLGCSGLMTIPEWISNLKSLQEFTIWECPNLTPLPEGIRNLASSCKLRLNRC